MGRSATDPRRKARLHQRAARAMQRTASHGQTMQLLAVGGRRATHARSETEAPHHPALPQRMVEMIDEAVRDPDMDGWALVDEVIATAYAAERDGIRSPDPETVHIEACRDLERHRSVEREERLLCRDGLTPDGAERLERALSEARPHALRLQASLRRYLEEHGR